MQWEHHKNILSCINDLHKDGYEICVIEQTEETTLLQEVSALPKRPTALIFGNEVNGVSQEVINLCKESIDIPQLGTKHSLNVSVAAGIVIWKYYEMLKTQNK